MGRVLLQKQAHAAQSFLLQWLSGYAFHFNMDSNLERAKKLRRSAAANLRAWQRGSARGVPTDAESRYAWVKRMTEKEDLLAPVTTPHFAAVDMRLFEWPPSAAGASKMYTETQP